MSKKRKKKITNLGRSAPSSFKFGLIVSVAILWTEFLKNVFDYLIASFTNLHSPISVSFIVALLFTILAFFLLDYYTKIRNKLKKVKV